LGAISSALLLLAMPLQALAAAPGAGTVSSGAPTVNAAPIDVDPMCFDNVPGQAHCLALWRADLGVQAEPSTSGGVSAATSFTPSGYGPKALQSAYSLPASAGGSAPTAGAGKTVAIVDAYDLPSAEADLAAYRALYGLPACTTANGCFRKLNQSGAAGPYPPANASWGAEAALDIDMVSAICPACKIILVEANSAGYADLAASVNTAVALGAVAVSNSYGGPEAYGPSYESAYNHPGVAIVAATGDCGFYCAGGSAGVDFPASSPHVIAVGGTTLKAVSNAPAGSRGWTESAWLGAGSGCSSVFAKPAWQSDTACAKRMLADVSAVADPATGVSVYDSGIGGWVVFGGTSVASPIIASVYALAGTPSAGTYPASYLYTNTGLSATAKVTTTITTKPASAVLNDVTSGTNNTGLGSCSAAYFCTGVSGYDGPTGAGTPAGLAAFTAPAMTWSATLSSSPKPGANGTVVSRTGSSLVLSAVANAAPTAPYKLMIVASGNTGGTIDGSAKMVAACASGKTCVAAASSSVAGPVSYYAVIGSGDLATILAASPALPVLWSNLPGAPSSVAALSGNASAAVSWTAAGADVATPVTSYKVTAAPGGKTCTTSTSTACTVTGLTNGTSYTFTVVATNIAGAGPASAPSAPVIPVTVPGAPGALKAVPGEASATISWVAPGSNGGSPITGYTVTSISSVSSAGLVTKLAGPGCSTSMATAGGTIIPTACTIAGLTDGASYTFAVTAQNAMGSSAASASSAAVIPGTPPGTPSGVSAVAGSTNAVISWTAPASAGSNPISGYTVTSTPGGKTCTTAVSSTVTVAPTSCTISGLTNGTAYTFTVVARSVVGPGPASAPSASVTPATKPGTPTGVTASARSGGAQVAWNAPSSNGGSAIIVYTVTLSGGGRTVSAILTMTPGSPTAPLTVAVSGLTNGVAYSVSVSATNALGTSSNASASGKLTPSASAPSLPVSK
jgi:hypothetical protein